MISAPNDAATQHNETRSKRGATAWILADGKAGNLAPARGLAATLGLTAREWDVTPRKPFLWLPPSLWPPGVLGTPAPVTKALEQAIQEDPPVVLLSCGRRAVAAALALKKRTGALAVHIQNPRVPPGRFDLVVAPAHDQLTGSNVEVTQGSMHGVTPSRLEEARADWADRLFILPEPRIAISIGGSNKAYTLDAGRGAEIGAQLRQIVQETGAGLMVTGSRRTDPAAWQAITSALEDTSALCWNGEGENPYFGFLAWADRVVVTGDSVNMVSEAAATGKPVHVIRLPVTGRAEKFERFHAAFEEAGISRRFEGRLEDWDHVPPTDTERVATRVRALLADRGIEV